GGSYNYVIFDEEDITITEENGKKVNLSESSPPSFSLGSRTLAERVSRAAAAEPLEVSTEEWKGISARERQDRAVATAKRLQSEAENGNPISNEARDKELRIGVNAMKHWSRFAADPRKAALIDNRRELLTRAIFL